MLYYVLFDKIYKEEIAQLVAGGMNEEQAKKEAPSIKETQKMLQKWEQNDPETINLWREMNNWAFAGFDESWRCASSIAVGTVFKYRTTSGHNSFHFFDLILEIADCVVLDFCLKQHPFNDDATG